MELKVFVENFASQFEDTDLNLFTSNTKFRELEEWNSLIALSIIAMVDDVYGVQLKGDEIRTSNTIEEIFNIVKSKK